MRWNGGREAATVFVAALIVRVVFSWVMPPPPIVADAWDYDRLAHAIVDGQGYVSPAGLPTSERPPLYPYLLATLYTTFENGPFSARTFQIVINALTCVLVYLLARRHFGLAAARLAAVLAIFSLSFLFAGQHLLTETVAAFLMVASVLALDVALAGWRWTGFLLTGVLVGLSTLTKGTTLLLPLALMLPIWLAAQRNWRLATRAGALLLAGYLVALLPWTVRNYGIHGEFVPVATHVGVAVYSSYTPPEGKRFGFITRDATVTASMALPEAERSRFLFRAALLHIRDHIRDVPRLTFLKFLYFISPFDWELLGGDGVFNFTYALTVPLALYALWAVRWAGWRPVLLATAPCFMLLQALALYGSPRLRMPIEPLLMVLAGGGGVIAWRRADSYRAVFAGATALMLLAGFAAYMLSAEVKSISVGVLRSVGLW